MEMDNRNEKEFELGCYDFAIGVKAKLKQNQLNFILGQPGVGRNLLAKAFLMRAKITSPAKIIIFDEDSELKSSSNLYDKYTDEQSIENFMRNMVDDIYSQIRFQEIGVKPIEMIYFINAQPDKKWVEKLIKLTHNQYFSKLKTYIIWSSYLDKNSEWAKSVEETNNIIIQKTKNGVELNGIPIQITEKDNVISITTQAKTPDFNELAVEFKNSPMCRVKSEVWDLLDDFLKIRNNHLVESRFYDTIEEDFMKYYKWFMEEI